MVHNTVYESSAIETHLHTILTTYTMVFKKHWAGYENSYLSCRIHWWKGPAVYQTTLSLYLKLWYWVVLERNGLKIPYCCVCTHCVGCFDSVDDFLPRFSLSFGRLTRRHRTKCCHEYFRNCYFTSYHVNSNSDSSTTALNIM